MYEDPSKEEEKEEKNESVVSRAQLDTKLNPIHNNNSKVGNVSTSHVPVHSKEEAGAPGKQTLLQRIPEREKEDEKENEECPISLEPVGKNYVYDISGNDYYGELALIEWIARKKTWPKTNEPITRTNYTGGSSAIVEAIIAAEERGRQAANRSEIIKTIFRGAGAGWTLGVGVGTIIEGPTRIFDSGLIGLGIGTVIGTVIGIGRVGIRAGISALRRTQEEENTGAAGAGAAGAAENV